MNEGSVIIPTRLTSSEESCGKATVKILSVVGVLLLCVCGCSKQAPETHSAGGATAAGGSATQGSDPVGLVSQAVQTNRMGITAMDLLSRKNPKGEGVFVYVTPQRFKTNVDWAAPGESERTAVWMVIDSKAFNLNSTAQMITPALPWPRQGSKQSWKKTNIDAYSGASDAMKILFPTASPTMARPKSASPGRPAVNLKEMDKRGRVVPPTR